MIKAIFQADEDLYRSLDVSGHAEYGAYGKDLICASVSSIMFGFILLFLMVTMAILFTQWNLDKNLDYLRERNKSELEARNAYRKAIDSKEVENEMKTRIIQNRQNINQI